MSPIYGVVSCFVFTFLSAEAIAADAPAWDSYLVANYSARWKAIQKELKVMAPKLDKLPAIPIDDQGGTGGHASHHRTAQPSAEEHIAFEIQWAGTETVDLIALVPARRYDAKGLDAQYGLPLAFTVELIDAQGGVIRSIAREGHTRHNKVRKGHPFVYQVLPPVAAAGLRISADRLAADDEEESIFVHAWAEALVFSQEHNVALGAKVKSISGSTPPAPWHWAPAFLVDGETPLGLPEILTEAHDNIGWMSEAKASATEAASLSVDLGEISLVDAVRLIPAKKPTSDLPSGFGFPRKLTISCSETGGVGTWSVVAERERANPGHNQVLIHFPPLRARHLRVEATLLWKAYDDYPAFFALSELEVLSQNRNVALAKGMQSPEANPIASSESFWSSAALSDGFGPAGLLVPTREWMLQLDQRLRLESRRYRLIAEAEQLADRWRRTFQIGFAVLALAGAFLIIVLPIRYRLHANRELLKIRERIAGDLHDEVGSNLGSIQMFADLAEGRSGGSDELKRIQRIAAETVSAVRDIVWLLRPTGDHRIGTVEHLRETSSIMLETLQWKFTADEEAWQTELPEESNRDLFLFFREALHNIMRHAKARAVAIHAETTEDFFRLVIHDDGVGIDAKRLERPATLRALRQRSEALRAELRVDSSSEKGTKLDLTIPLRRKQR